MDKIYKKLSQFFEKLSSKPIVGGLELADSMLRFVFLKNGQVLTFSSRLPSGVMKDGKIANEGQFLEVLKQLRAAIAPEKNGRYIQVVVSLPTAIVYTQSFDVPNLGEEKVKEAAILNLQALSPINAEKAYLSWQTINVLADRYELLGAVVEKEVIDRLRILLETAGFNPITIEFPALALGRLVSEVAKKNEPVLVMWISPEGLNFFILRGESLYFDYFRSWRSIQESGRDIPRSVFESIVTDEVKRVINFTTTRFHENLREVFIVAPGFEDELKTLIETNFGLVVLQFKTATYSTLAPSWYVALGSAIRGNQDRSRDKFIALGTESSASLFYEEQVMNFVRLWRNIFIGALGSLFIILFISATYLVQQSKVLSQRVLEIRGEAPEPDFANLKKAVQEFNTLVEAVGRIRGDDRGSYQFLVELQKITRDNGVTIDGLNFTAPDRPINLLAHAADYQAVQKIWGVFKSKFCKVELPLNIKQNEDNSVNFTIIFQVKC